MGGWFPPRHHTVFNLHRFRPVLFVNGRRLVLSPRTEVRMQTTVNVGHTIALSLKFLDINGNPMLTPPVPDAAPVWTNTAAAEETLVAAASGLTAIATALAPGADTVNVALTVGGVAFAASLDVAVTAAPQVLGSVVIEPAVS